MNKKALGNLGEDIAASYLKKNKKYKILFRNYLVPRYGEIDIIALDRESIVFIEVKSRKSNSMVSPIEAVDQYKMMRVYRAIDHFLSNEDHEFKEYPARFEVVGLIFDSNNKVCRIDHLLG